MGVLLTSIRNGGLAAAAGGLAAQAATAFCVVQGGPLGAAAAQECGQVADVVVTGAVSIVVGLGVGVFTGVRELRRRIKPAGESSGPPSS